MNTPDNDAPQPIGRATYKGRDYALLWKGPTQYGERVKLAFLDDHDETFWIDADRIDAIELFASKPADERPQNRSRQSRRRRPTDDGPRRRREDDEPAGEPAADPDDAEACYCASCGQPLPQFA